MDGLVTHYLKDLTCPRTWSERKATRENELEDRFGYLVGLAKEWDVNAVILFIIRYCDNFAFDVPDVRDYLQEAGLKVLHIETDYAITHPAQLKARCQAFVEMIQP
jgi:benzoyl-CoA reductase/2-hydroxyglutaryl-CoA dehydratase subunit BcrC/BadD/HgdB